MTRLLITRGLPASGKTTFARKLQPRVVRVNRDDLRRMLHGERLYTQWAEGQVTHAQRAMVEALLRAHADVIVDDTNLRNKTVREWAELAARLGAQFEVHDFTDVPLEECIRRDVSRPAGDQVGEEAIRRMHARYLAGRNLPLPIPYVSEISVNVYEPDPELPAAVLVDIDGTVALMGDRSPYDWHRVGSDLPNHAVITAVRDALYASKIVSYAQGMELLSAASEGSQWNLNFGDIATIWRGGCIIRAKFLNRIKEAYERDPKLHNLLLDQYFTDIIGRTQDNWRVAVATAVTHGVAVPAFSASLGYFDSYRSARLPANLLQAQRDFFGAHTYERVDKPGVFPPTWFAQACLLAGEKAEAMHHIDVALKSKLHASYFTASDLRHDPNWAPLRGDPEFNRLIAYAEQVERADGK